MEQRINLHRIEKEALSAVFSTGLVDIEIGLILIVSALAMIFDDISYYLDILYIVPIIFIILATKYIINPRMGVVRFSKKRLKKRMIMWISITIILVVLVGLQLIGISFVETGSINPRITISLILLFICLAIAYFMEYYRMYFYAVLLVGIFNFSEEIRENGWLSSETGYAYLIGAVIMFLIGSVYLVRFLKKHPMPGKEDDYQA